MDSDLTRRHYELEKKLRQRILASAPEERSRVVQECYDELYSTITWHSGLKRSADQAGRKVLNGLALYDNLIPHEGDVLEIGCGTGYLAMALAARHPHTQFAATDISAVKLNEAHDHANLTFKSAAATSLPFPDGSFNLVYHSQLLEHLHPDDVSDHFQEVARVLRPGGVFAFDTPSGVTGPHDISRNFDKVATGFHLREWTYSDLWWMQSRLAKAGFVDIRSDIPVFGVLARRLDRSALATRCLIPIWPKVDLERVLESIGNLHIRRLLGRVLGVTGVYVVLRKRR